MCCVAEEPTTGIGFGSAIVARHLGLHEMGVLALIGVGRTFLLSTVALPVVLRVFEGTAESDPIDDELEVATAKLPALPRPSLHAQASGLAPSTHTTGTFARSAR